MTCVVGIVDKERNVFLASDSQLTRGYKKSYGLSKLFRVKNWIVGVSGSYRICDMIETEQDLRFNIESKKDLIKWRDMLFKLSKEKAGYKAESTNDSPMIHNLNLIIAFKDTMYVIHSDYSIEHVTKFYSIGSGSDNAFGAYSVIDKSLPALSIAKMCVKAAIDNDTYCSGKIQTKALRNERKQ